MNQIKLRASPAPDCNTYGRLWRNGVHPLMQFQRCVYILCQRALKLFWGLLEVKPLPKMLSVGQLTSVLLFVVLIDAIVRNGGTAAPEANHVPPPTGWRDEDIRNSETSNASVDEKKSYTEEQRQGVLRCTETLYLFFHTGSQRQTDPCHCSSSCNVGCVTCSE